MDIIEKAEKWYDLNEIPVERQYNKLFVLVNNGYFLELSGSEIKTRANIMIEVEYNET